MKIKELKLHKVVELLPEMLEPEYIMLKTDIKMFGIKEPLSVIGNEIIDGRHRFRAAKELKLKDVPVEEIDITEDELDNYVLSLNLTRRHLNPGQKALIAIEVFDRAGTAEIPIKGASTLKRRKSTFTKDIAEIAGVGGSTVEYVQYVRKNGTEDDIRTLRSGIETAKSIMNKIKKRLSPPKEKTTVPSSNNIATTREQELEKEVLSLTVELESIQAKALDKKIEHIRKHGNDVQRQAISRKDPKVVEQIYKVVHDTYTTTKGMSPAFPPPTNKSTLPATGSKDYTELKQKFKTLSEDYDLLLDKCMELEMIIANDNQEPEKVKDYTQLHGSDITPNELDQVKLAFSDHDTYKRLMAEYQKEQNAN